jgi:phytoene synthase
MTTLAAAYRICRQVVHQADSSFTWGFWLLPKDQRQAMEALYAFARRTDDLVDDARDSDTAQRQIQQWRDALACTLASDSLGDADPVLAATVDAARRFAIPHETLFEIVDGVSRDALPEPLQFATFDDLRGYCRQVASAVGIACLYIWGFRGEDALEQADHCGIAFQLVNIIRDFKEDFQRGRCYVPVDELRSCGLSPNDWMAAATDQMFLKIVRAQTDRAALYFERARGLDLAIAKPGRHLYRLMSHSYQQLLEQIIRSPLAVRRERTRLPWSGRLKALARTLAGTSP